AMKREDSAMLQLSLESGRGESTYSRRAFLRTTLLTAGALSLPTLLQRQAFAGRPRRDTAVIQLWLGGGPSHLAMYDLKPTPPSAGSITSLLRGPNRRGMVPYVHIAPDPMGFPVFVKVHDSGYLGPSYDPFRIESVRAKADPNRLDLNNLIGKVQFKLPN